MRRLVTADLHWNDLPRDAYRHAFVDWLAGVAAKWRVDHIDLLGDLCEDRDYHSGWLVNKVVDHLHRLSDGCSVTCLRGNHDYSVADNPFFAFVGWLPRVRWINTPTVLDGDLYLPHTADYARDWSDVRVREHECIFAHNTFDGSDDGYGHKLRGVPLSVFPRNVCVVSGDVHTPQSVGPVTYVGAPYTVDFGDSYQPRVLLHDGQRWESIEVPGPRKRVLRWSTALDAPRVVEESIAPGDIVKVMVKLRDRADWPRVRDSVHAWCERAGCVLHAVVPTIVDASAHGSSASDTVERLSDDEVLARFGSARGVPERTMRVGAKLLRGV